MRYWQCLAWGLGIGLVAAITENLIDLPTGSVAAVLFAGFVWWFWWRPRRQWARQQQRERDAS